MIVAGEHLNGQQRVGCEYRPAGTRNRSAERSHNRNYIRCRRRLGSSSRYALVGSQARFPSQSAVDGSRQLSSGLPDLFSGKCHRVCLRFRIRIHRRISHCLPLYLSLGLFSVLPAPLTVSLEFTPTARFDVINVNDRTKTIERDLQRFPQALYCSYHTTAGYLDQGFVSRLQGLMGIYPYMQIFQTIFPKDAGYHHDELNLRYDLSEGQRAVEPRNGDAHLAFIAAGMSNCVRYTFHPRPQ